jgi:hypothetical protein
MLEDFSKWGFTFPKTPQVKSLSKPTFSIYKLEIEKVYVRGLFKVGFYFSENTSGKKSLQTHFLNIQIGN